MTDNKDTKSDKNSAVQAVDQSTEQGAKPASTPKTPAKNNSTKARRNNTRRSQSKSSTAASSTRSSITSSSITSSVEKDSSTADSTTVNSTQASSPSVSQDNAVADKQDRSDPIKKDNDSTQIPTNDEAENNNAEIPPSNDDKLATENSTKKTEMDKQNETIKANNDQKNDNKDDIKQGSSPEKSVTAEPIHHSPTQVKEKSSSNVLSFVFALILIILMAGVAFLAYQNHLATLNSLKLEQKISELEKNNQTQALDSQRVNESLNKIEVIAKQQQQQSTQLTQLNSTINQQNPNDWVLAEANYLVKTAGRKLQLEQDTSSAQQLLIDADKRLASLNNPALIDIRKAISQDIASIQAVKPVDRDGLVLKLLTLQQNVNKLPLTTQKIIENSKQESEISNDVKDWKSNLSISLKQFMGNFITVKKIDGNAPQFLQPDQHVYLQENIKAKLDTAIKAIYSQNNEMYQESLNIVKTWNQQYFNPSSHQVQQFEKELTQLQQQNIILELPKTLSSLEPLNQWVSKRLGTLSTNITSEGE